MLVCRLAEAVLQLRPDMRSFGNPFKFSIEHANTIERMSQKGISNLKHFKLDLMYNSAEKYKDFFNKWKDHVIDLKILPENSQGVPGQFKNLEGLGLLENKAISNSCDIMKDIINMHSNKLRILRIELSDAFNIEDCNNLPSLESLYLHCYNTSPSVLQKPVLQTRCQSISALTLSGNIGFDSISVADLRMSNLKQLRIFDSPKALNVLHANAEQLKILSINAEDIKWYNVEPEGYPEHLPKLKMFHCRYTNDRNITVIPPIMAASAGSLEHLVLNCVMYASETSNSYYLAGDLGKMEKLTDFVFDHEADMTDDVIEESADTLELITVGTNDTASPLRLPQNMNKLKEIIFTHNRAETPVVCQPHIKQSYPNVKLKVERADSQAEYVNTFMKKHGFKK